jgi:hypothetical protein
MKFQFRNIANWFSGRHTFFIVACFVAGGIMSWFHRLDASFVTLLLGLQGMVLAHSTQENYFKKDSQ